MFKKSATASADIHENDMNCEVTPPTPFPISENISALVNGSESESGLGCSEK